MNGFWLRAACAGRDYAPAALDRPFWAAPSTSPLRTFPLCQQWVEFWFVSLHGSFEREGQTASL